MTFAPAAADKPMRHPLFRFRGSTVAVYTETFALRDTDSRSDTVYLSTAMPIAACLHHKFTEAIDAQTHPVPGYPVTDRQPVVPARVGSQPRHPAQPSCPKRARAELARPGLCP